jgi:ABC-2 type transport system permease protein
VRSAKYLLARRQLLALMVRQNMKQRYGKYRFGLLWTLGEPLLMAILMFIVFTFILGRGQSIGLEPFIVYLITGLLPFAWLSTAIGQGPGTFRRNGPLITFSKLPTYIWPMRSVAVGFVELVLSIPVAILLIVAFDAPVTWAFVLLPIGFIAQFFLCLGFATLFASLAVNLPDVEQISGLVVRIFFWTSPILWFQREFPEWLSTLIYLNPFYGILDFYRVGMWPDQVLGQPRDYLMSGSVIVMILAAGLIGMRAKTAHIRRLG